MDQYGKSNHTVNWGSTHGATLNNLCTFTKLTNTSATTSAFQNGYIILRQRIKLECDMKMWVSVLSSLFLSVSSFRCQLLDAHQLTPTCRKHPFKNILWKPWLQKWTQRGDKLANRWSDWAIEEGEEEKENEGRQFCLRWHEMKF